MPAPIRPQKADRGWTCHPRSRSKSVTLTRSLAGSRLAPSISVCFAREVGESGAAPGWEKFLLCTPLPSSGVWVESQCRWWKLGNHSMARRSVLAKSPQRCKQSPRWHDLREPHHPLFSIRFSSPFPARPSIEKTMTRPLRGGAS